MYFAVAILFASLTMCRMSSKQDSNVFTVLKEEKLLCALNLS